jgi:hypothetical protein
MIEISIIFVLSFGILMTAAQIFRLRIELSVVHRELTALQREVTFSRMHDEKISDKVDALDGVVRLHLGDIKPGPYR